MTWLSFDTSAAWPGATWHTDGTGKVITYTPGTGESGSENYEGYHGATLPRNIADGGKWYQEVEVTGDGITGYSLGISQPGASAADRQSGAQYSWNGKTVAYDPGADSGLRCPCPAGQDCSSGWDYDGYGGTRYSWAGFNKGDVIGIALDADNRELTFYVNGVSQNFAFTGDAYYRVGFGKPAGCYLDGTWVVMVTAVTTINTEVKLTLLAQGDSGYNVPEGFTYW